MGEEIANTKIKYKGLFNSSSLYNFIVDYFDSNGFSFSEKEFKYEDDNGKINLKTKIEFEKEYEKDIKVSGKMELKIDNMEDVVVKKKEESLKLQKGSVEIKIKAEYEDNYGNDAKSFSEKVLLEIYKNIIAKKHFKKIKEKAEEEMAELIKGIKKELNLYAYLE